MLNGLFLWGVGQQWLSHVTASPGLQGPGSSASETPQQHLAKISWKWGWERGDWESWGQGPSREEAHSGQAWGP